MGILYSIFVLFILPLGVALFISFYVMKAAVKFATEEIEIKAKKDSKVIIDKEDSDKLRELRDMEILSDTELGKAIEAYKSVRMNKENNEQYLKYSKMLNELKDVEFSNQDLYDDKINRLKKHFNID